MTNETLTLTPPPAGSTSTSRRTSSPTPATAGRLRGLWRGHHEDPGWARPALLGLLALTAVLYLWGLGASGWGNAFYSAAAQAGSDSWKAFFFGSSDAASSITVDKTPMSLWAMALSVRLFGLSAWSVLVPQALMGVASVGVLHGTVRRTTGSAVAGLVAGTVLALTPVAVLMFRFDNPDALLVLLLISSVAATVRALESTRLEAAGLVAHPVRWLALGGALVGFAFLTKMLQAFLVLPGLALVYLLAAHTPLGRRVLHLLVALGAMLLAGGWWVAVVELWPASSRPYVGGSQHNSILELMLGYNGLGRLTGEEAGSVAGGNGWGVPGVWRLLDAEIGGQVAWLLPTSLVLLVAGLWFTRRAPRQDLVRAGLVVWGGWLVVTAATFSLMAGIFHAYYTVALAPAIGALVSIGSLVLWRQRASYAASLTLAGTVGFTATVGFFLLDRTPDFLPWLKWAVVLVGLVSALALAGAGHLPRRLGVAAAVLALVAVLAGPAAYSVATAATPHTGSVPSAGPASASGPGRGRAPQAPGAMGVPRGAPQGGPPGAPQGAPGGAVFGGGAFGTTGGLLQSSESSSELTAMLRRDADSYTWAAAAIGANTAAGYQLASEQPVMPVGGFNGSDPSPTLEQFQALVANGEIHYFIAGGVRGGQGTSSDISSWVAATSTATTVDGVTVYDLSGGVR